MGVKREYSGWWCGGEDFQEMAVPWGQRLHSRVKKRDEEFQERSLQQELEERKNDERQGRKDKWDAFELR